MTMSHRKQAELALDASNQDRHGPYGRWDALYRLGVAGVHALLHLAEKVDRVGDCIAALREEMESGRPR